MVPFGCVWPVLFVLWHGDIVIVDVCGLWRGATDDVLVAFPWLPFDLCVVPALCHACCNAMRVVCWYGWLCCCTCVCSRSGGPAWKRHRRRQRQSPGAGMRPYPRSGKKGDNKGAKHQQASPGSYAQPQHTARSGAYTARSGAHTSRTDASFLYMHGQYTSRSRRGPHDAAAIESHIKRRNKLRDKLAARAAKRREVQSEEEAEKVQKQLREQYLKAMRRDADLARYWHRRNQGEYSSQWDESGKSLTSKSQHRLHVLGHVDMDDDGSDDGGGFSSPGHGGHGGRARKRHHRRRSRRSHRRSRSSKRSSKRRHKKGRRRRHSSADSGGMSDLSEEESPHRRDKQSASDGHGDGFDTVTESARETEEGEWVESRMWS